MSFNAGEIEANLTLNRDPFQRGIAEAIAEGEALAEKEFTSTASLDTAGFLQGIAAVEAEKAALATGVTVPVTFTIDSAAITKAIGAAFSGAEVNRQLGKLFSQSFSSAAAETYLTEVLGLKASEAQSDLAGFLAGMGMGGGSGGGSGGAGSLGAGSGGGGFLGTASQFADARAMQFFGVPAQLAGGIALALPVVISFASAVAVAAIGLTALAVAAAPAFVEIGEGVSSVDTATTAVNNAVAGTSAWASAIQGVGTAWAGIDPQLQPVVAQILALMNGGQAGVFSQAQSWAVGVAENVLGAVGGKAGSVFEPLIMSTEVAVDKLILGVESAIGSGGLQNTILGLARDVQPAIAGLASLALNIGRVFIAIGRAAGYGGEGMGLLENLTGLLARLAQSPVLAGFIEGFVTVDRIVVQTLSDLLRIGSAIDKYLNVPFTKTVGIVLGVYVALDRVLKLLAVLPGLGMLKGGLATLGTDAGAAGAAGRTGSVVAADVAGAAEGTAAGGVGAALTDFLSGAVGSAAVAGLGAVALGRLWNIGIAPHLPGAAGAEMATTNLSQADAPFSNAWLKHGAQHVLNAGNDVLGFFGFGSHSTSAINARNAVASYNAELMKLIPVAEQTAAATAADNQAWQQSAGSLVKAAFGSGTFTKLMAAAPQSFGSMVEGLQSRNSALQGWTHNFTSLLQRLGPAWAGSVALIANQAPQDLGTLVNELNKNTPAAKQAVENLMVGIEEELLAGKVAEQTTMLGIVNVISTAFHSTIPAVKEAAREIGLANDVMIAGIESAWVIATNRIASLIGSTAAAARSLMSQGLAVSPSGNLSFNLAHRAGGGSVSALNAYIVGELGPELFVPGASGAIVPNATLNSSSTLGGGGLTLIVQVDASNSVDPGTTKAMVADAINAAIPKIRMAIKQGAGINV